MKFVCDKCSTRYSIAEERVRGKILKIRCKNCGNVVTVREGMDAEPVNRTGKATMAVPLISPSALAEPSGPAPAALQEEWYVSIDGVQSGPLTLPDAQKWVAGKPFGAELHCWNEGFDDWLPVEKVSHFRNLRKPPVRQRTKTAPPPVPEKPLFAATMASLEKGASGPNGSGGVATKPAAAAAVGKPVPPVRQSAPAIPRPALPKPSSPALPRPATPGPAATAAANAAAHTEKPASTTPIRGSASSVLTARPAASATANKVISSVGSKGPASSGAAALADAFGADDAADALTAVSAPAMFADDAPAVPEPARPAPRAPLDIKSMREALDDEDDGLSIGEVSRVVKLADLAPRPKTKSMGGGTGSLQRIAASNSGMPRAATSASASLTGTQQKMSPSELGMNVDPALAAAATRPGEVGPDDSVVAASIAQKHRRGLIALIAFSALLVAGLIGVVAWKVSQNPDEVGGGLGGTKQIDTSRPEDIIRRQQQQPVPDTGSGSATHVTTTHRPRNPINSSGSQAHEDPADDSLQAGEVEDMAAKQNEGTMRCYMRAQKGAMGFEIADIKKIAVTLGVNKDGAVTDVQLSSHGNDSFGQCLIARIKAWRFRASPSGGTFRISLAFGS